jgi:uncharacterized membrane protein YjjB (DUF3815 family)
MSPTIPWILLLTWAGWGWVSFAMTSGNGTEVASAVAGILALGALHVFVWRRSLINAPEAAP